MILRALKSAVIYIAAALAALLALYRKGRRDQLAAQERAAAEAYRETRKELADALHDLGDDPRVLRDWLHARDPKKP